MASHFIYPPAGTPRLIFSQSLRAARIASRFFLSRKDAIQFFLSRLLRRRFIPSLTQDANFRKAIEPYQKDLQICVSLGTPGPYNKATFLLYHESGEFKYVGKVANTRDAISLLKAEADRLTKLAEIPGLELHVPQLVDTFSERENWGIIQSVVDGRRLSRSLQPLHADFLIKMYNATASSYLLEDSYFFSNILQNRSHARKIFPTSWEKRVDRVLLQLERSMQNAQTTVTAHRDFTHWNMRRNNAGHLVVFDWEYSSERYPVAHDLFHYLLLPRVLRHGKKAFNFSKTMTELRAYIDSMNFPKDYSHGLEAQALAYLLDTSLFYIASWSSWNPDSNVVNIYGNLLDQLCE